jgi:hypothetical protein
MYKTRKPPQLGKELFDECTYGNSRLGEDVQTQSGAKRERKEEASMSSAKILKLALMPTTDAVYQTSISINGKSTITSLRAHQSNGDGKMFGGEALSVRARNPSPAR